MSPGGKHGRGRGRYGPTGVPPGGARALPAPGDEGETEPASPSQFTRGGARGGRGSRGRGGRGGKRSGATRKSTPAKEPVVKEPAANASKPAESGEEEMDGSFQKNSGNSKAAPDAGIGSSASYTGAKRGRKPRRDTEPAKNSQKRLDSFFTPKPVKKRTRTDRVDSSDEEQEGVENKAPRVEITSQERIISKKLITKLATTQAITKEKCEEYNTLIDLAVNEKEYMTFVKRSIDKGKPVKIDAFNIDMAMYAKKKELSMSRLHDLADTEAKAITYVSPDTSTTTDTSVDTTDTAESGDDDVFTDTDRE